jgi:hypothetical protein
MTPPRIFADFNNADTKGRLRLITHGSVSDIEKQEIKLTNGMALVVYDDDLSADAEVIFSEEENIWVAKIDWSKIIR